jgi:hypothetical protein
MKAITEAREIEKYKKLAAEMMLADEYEESEFRPDWILRRGWNVQNPAQIIIAERSV